MSFAVGIGTEILSPYNGSTAMVTVCGVLVYKFTAFITNHGITSFLCYSGDVAASPTTKEIVPHRSNLPAT